MMLLAPLEAAAGECSDARAKVAHYKSAAAIEETQHHAAQAFEAKSALDEAKKKRGTACVPHKSSVAALPIAYVPVPPGNLSKVTVTPPEGWALTVTTMAGASGGVVYAPATVTLPPELHWETTPTASPAANELLVAVAFDVPISVEETDVGKGDWRLEPKSVQLVPLSKLRACKDLPAKIPASSCAMLASIDPARPGTVPPRGRAFSLGEWQYGYRATLELDQTELGQPGANDAPARLDLTLDLSAPIPGFSDGKKLAVTYEANASQRGLGATFKLAHGGCGDEDEACEKQRFAVEIWLDRVFGVPFLHAVSGATDASLLGKVTDRLARAMANQRVVCTQGTRRVIATTDDHGDYRFDRLMSGDASVVPVGKDPSNTPKGDETRAVKVGLHDTKAPVIFVNKLWQ
jgi:hypothetical protein